MKSCTIIIDMQDIFMGFAHSDCPRMRKSFASKVQCVLGSVGTDVIFLKTLESL